MKRRDMLLGAATAGAAGVALLAAGTESARAQATPPQTAGGVLDRIIKEKKIRTDPRSRLRASLRGISASSWSSCR